MNDVVDPFYGEPKIFLSDKMYIEYGQKHRYEKHDYQIYVIGEIENSQIVCVCNPNVMVTQEYNTKDMFYYCTKTLTKISSAKDFICWSNNQALENDRKDGGIILKEFVSSDPVNTKVCVICKKSIDTEQIREKDKMRIHNDCYVQFE